MKKWKKWIPIIVPVEETTSEKLYFVTRGAPNRTTYWSRGLNGKLLWSVKPGIAVRVPGGPLLKKDFDKPANKAMDLQAVEVPEDADTRWKARKPPRRKY